MNITYVDIRDAVIAHLKRVFQQDRRLTVEAHPGLFDEAEIRRLVQRTPAILTSIMSIAESSAEDESFIEFVSWVLYRADNLDRLYSGALALVSALVGALKQLDIPASFGNAKDIRAECLYSGSLDKINATLWAVRWKLPARAVNDDGVIILPDDLDWFQGYDSTLKVGTQQADDSIQLL